MLQIIVSADRSHAPGTPGAHALAPDVVMLVVWDGSARLLHFGRRFHAVSAVGTRMIRELLAGDPDRAAARIAADYRIPPARARADLDGLVTTLRRERLIVPADARQAFRGRWGGWVLRAGLRWAHRPGLSLHARARRLLTLARVSCRAFGWAATVAAWGEFHPGPPAAGEGDTTAAARAIDAAVRDEPARHLLHTECKERALAGWSLLRAAGLPAALVVGVRLYPLEGHCWCESAGEVFDDPARCAEFIPVTTYQ